MARLKARRYAFRVQQFNASSTKPRRVKLIAQRRIFKDGKTVTSGQEVGGKGKAKLKAMIAKAKPKMLRGTKMAPKVRQAPSAEVHAKVGNKWKKPIQNG